MANKYNNHPQAGQEDIAEQRLIALRHIQKYQQQQHQQQQQKHQHFNPGPGYYYPKTYYNNSNFQKLVMKSTLNPNAKEFYPSYLDTYKNGYAHSLNNVMCSSSQDYEYGGWPKYEYDNRYIASGRYMQGQVQRSNTVLPLMRDNYSGSGSTTAESQSTSFQESNSIDNRSKLMNSDIVIENPAFHGSNNLKSGENVWFIEKRIETNKDNSKELWPSQVEAKESYSKEEYYDPQISWTDSSAIKDLENDNDSIPGTENKIKNEERSEDAIADSKKLIMLYPTKKQHEDVLCEGSQESIFEEPNPINYTSDESFLVQSNCNSSYNNDVNQIIRDGKQFYSTNTKPDSEILDEMEDSSEEFERTAKQSDSRSYEIIDRDTSKCALEQNQESLPTKCKMISKKIEVRIIRKIDSEKARKVYKPDLSEKDSKAHEGPPNAKEPRLSNPKAKKPTTTSATAKEEPKTSTRLSQGGFTGTRFSTAGSTSKATDTTTKTLGKTSITGAIPKTRENPTRTTRRISYLNEESVNKSTRTLPPRGNSIRKEEKDTETRTQRLPNGFVTSRAQGSANARRIDAGSNNHSEMKSVAKTEYSPKKSVPKDISRSKSVERKTIPVKNTEGCSQNSKNLSLSPSTHTNISGRKNTTFSTRERQIQKSVVKTQMRSTTNMCSTAPTKKIIVINNVPKRENELKKSKTSAVSRNNEIKTNKATASTKIPVRQKSTSLKGVKGVIGSDGDNIKVKTSKSCISLWSAGKKNLAKGSSISSIQIGDKLSENKKKVPSRERPNSTTRHAPMKRQSVSLQ